VASNESKAEIATANKISKWRWRRGNGESSWRLAWHGYNVSNVNGVMKKIKLMANQLINETNNVASMKANVKIIGGGIESVAAWRRGNNESGGVSGAVSRNV